MATAFQLVQDLHRRRAALSNRTSASVLAAWERIDKNNLDTGWDQLNGEMALAVYDGQLASATLSKPFVDEIVGDQAPPVLDDPRLYAGVAPDGRAVAPLLYGAVTETKRLTAAGWAVDRAYEAGAAFLAAAVQTMLADAGRNRDMVYGLGRGTRQYIRAVSPNACSRCAILAGIHSSAVAFPRHPNCQCVAVPVTDQSKLSLRRFSSPSSYFDSLSRAEQNKIFTNAGAQAIRDGADIFKVVNARRGAGGISYSGAIGRSTTPNSGRRLTPTQIGVKPDGSPLLVYTTREGTTRSGAFARQQRELNKQDPSRLTIKTRLMPEQIYRMANGDPDRARELLVRYGYL